MKVILGLGNPGVEYQNTRHNAGILFVEWLASSVQRSDYGWRKKKNIWIYETEDLLLIKSANIFMNESGKLITSPSIPLLSLGEGSRRQGEVWVAHDDLDLRLGEYKIQKGVGPKLHYGVQSVEEALKTKDFWRIRIGVDNRDVTNRIPGEDYVLQKFTSEEREVLNSVFAKIHAQLISSQ